MLLNNTRLVRTICYNLLFSRNWSNVWIEDKPWKPPFPQNILTWTKTLLIFIEKRNWEQTAFSFFPSYFSTVISYPLLSASYWITFFLFQKFMYTRETISIYCHPPNPIISKKDILLLFPLAFSQLIHYALEWGGQRTFSLMLIWN